MDTTVTVTKAATKSGSCILSSTSPSPSSSSSFYANNNNTNNSSNNEEEEDSMIHHHQHQHQQSQTSSTSIMPLPYSFCILWSPLHPITAFFPFIGHMGISDSKGHSHDFQGPYYVGTDHSYPLPRMAFGYPTRYLRIQIDVDVDVDGISDNRVATSSEQQQQQSHRWDDSIGEANEIYKQRMHNICCDNCHSHVAKALNIMEYKGRHDWDMIKLCFLLFFQGSFVPSNTSGGGSAGGGNISSYISSILLQFGPFLVILLLIILLSTKILS